MPTEDVSPRPTRFYVKVDPTMTLGELKDWAREALNLVLGPIEDGQAPT
jgi:hypothetical protein